MDPARIAKVVSLLWSLAGLPATSQQAAVPLTILCGSATDQYFVGTSQPQATCTLAAGQTCVYTNPVLPAAFPTLRYGGAVHYRIPVKPGVYFGELDLVEPNKTAAGQRIISVTVQGETAPPLDLFATAPGANVLYHVPFIAVAQVGVIDITVSGLTGNAVLSGIELAGAAITAELAGSHVLAVVSGPAFQRPIQ